MIVTAAVTGIAAVYTARVSELLGSEPSVVYQMVAPVVVVAIATVAPDVTSPATGVNVGVATAPERTAGRSPAPWNPMLMRTASFSGSICSIVPINVAPLRTGTPLEILVGAARIGNPVVLEANMHISLFTLAKGISVEDVPLAASTLAKNSLKNTNPFLMIVIFIHGAIPNCLIPP